MSPTWFSDAPPPALVTGAAGLLRAWVRIAAIGLVVLLGLVALFAARGLETVMPGPRRRWSPAVTQAVCRAALGILGLRREIEGRAMPGPGAVVANHSGWLDILVLNAGQPVRFVAKSEVEGWPGIGVLARATATLFVRRAKGEAAAQQAGLAAALEEGQPLLLFPEGTSSDGLRVLPFKSTLFAALHAGRTPVQPVTVVYTAPPGADPRSYGWWGDMALGPHLLAIMGLARQGHVRVIYHAPLDPCAYPDRKALARAAEARVRLGHPSTSG